MKRRWRYRGYDDAAAARLGAEHNLPRIVAVLLAQRAVTDPEAVTAFLEPTLAALHDPYRMLGMRLAVERVRRAIANDEKILVYGDYDVDGTTATVLLLKAIQLAGGQADFHIPHRVREGYGMREEVIEQAARENVRLLISVDTGIREAALVERAKELGIDSIITDHHLPEDEVPRALAVLNPNQPNCPYPDKNLSGVGVAFKLTQALLGELGWTPGRVEKVLCSMLKIVAIGTIADMVPLSGENRVFATIGLDGLRRPANPGLRALLEVAGLSNKARPGAGDVGFRIGPRLNAAGRMDTARDVVRLFMTDDVEEAEGIARKLDGLNAERQRTEGEVVEAIVEQLRNLPPPDVVPFIVVAGEGWHPGVIGIVASRIVERFFRPVLVLSVDPEKGQAVGSGRSIPAFHLLEGLTSLDGIFERYGGHKQAAGCTIRADRIGALRDGLNEYAVSVLGPEDFEPELKLDVELPFESITDETMAQIGRLAPYGLGNPTPLFSTPDVRLDEAPRVLKEKHLKLKLSHESRAFTAMGWRMAEMGPTLHPGDSLEAAYAIEADDYWGGWRLNLKDLRKAAN